MNTLLAREIQRRGMVAIEESLQRGPVHIIKRNQPVAVVLTEDEYARLTQTQKTESTTESPPINALDYLLALPPGNSTSTELQARLEEERNAWGPR